jgi:hypothetical protein|tara:strand:- start:194 stop:424 length:231 start_codon:yes stop_codon:yes gene_type:complete
MKGREAFGWAQESYIKAANNDPGDWFGYSVTLDNDTLAVGPTVKTATRRRSPTAPAPTATTVTVSQGQSMSIPLSN